MGRYVNRWIGRWLINSGSTSNSTSRIGFGKIRRFCLCYVLPCFTQFVFQFCYYLGASHYQHIFCAFPFNAVIPKCWLNSRVFFLKHLLIVQLSLSFGVNSTWFILVPISWFKYVEITFSRCFFTWAHFTYQHFQYFDFCFPYGCGLNSPHVQPSVAPNNDRQDCGK